MATNMYIGVEVTDFGSMDGTVEFDLFGIRTVLQNSATVAVVFCGAGALPSSKLHTCARLAHTHTHTHTHHKHNLDATHTTPPGAARNTRSSNVGYGWPSKWPRSCRRSRWPIEWPRSCRRSRLVGRNSCHRRQQHGA